jgi:catechol 2,3-dioxygenase
MPPKEKEQRRMSRHLLSQLAHVEILSPRPAETVAFLERLMGLEVSERAGQSAYLRGWGEFFHHSLKVTEAPQAGLGHVGWRADSAEDLGELSQALVATGQGVGWSDGDRGHGPAYCFRSPEGHLNEVFWEVERWQALPDSQSTLPDRPQKYTGRGAALRWLHHVNLNVSDTRVCSAFFQQHLGCHLHAYVVLDNTDTQILTFLSVAALDHDLAFTMNPAGGQGGLNHIAYAVDSREDVMRAADILRDHGHDSLEYGPGRHAVAGGFYLYAHEPGGNRIEVYTPETLILAPDWQPVRWLVSQTPMMYWGRGNLPGSPFGNAAAPSGRPPSPDELTGERP